MGILLNDLLIQDIPHMAEVLWVLVTLMIGPIVTMGRRWGKVITNWRFIRFWRLFFLFVAEVVAWVYVGDFTTPVIQGFLSANSAYLTAIAGAAIGTFFVWFVDGFGYSFRTQYKWLFVVICYGVSVLNIYLNHCTGFGTTC